MKTSGPIWQNGTISVNAITGAASIVDSTANAHHDVKFRATDGRTVTVTQLIDFMETTKKRLCMLDPALEKHEHYPALKAAYEDYLTIERLCVGDDKKNDNK